MIDFGSSIIPDWTLIQWLAVAGVVVLLGLAGLLIYAVFFAPPGGIYIVPSGTDTDLFWREIMNKREKLRGRITRRMIFYSCVALGFLGAAGGVVWFAW